MMFFAPIQHLMPGTTCKFKYFRLLDCEVEAQGYVDDVTPIIHQPLVDAVYTPHSWHWYSAVTSSTYTCTWKSKGQNCVQVCSDGAENPGGGSWQKILVGTVYVSPRFSNLWPPELIFSIFAQNWGLWNNILLKLCLRSWNLAKIGKNWSWNARFFLKIEMGSLEMENGLL